MQLWVVVFWDFKDNMLGPVAQTTGTIGTLPPDSFPLRGKLLLGFMVVDVEWNPETELEWKTNMVTKTTGIPISGF